MGHLMNALVDVHASFGDGARAFQDVKTLAPLMKPKMLKYLIAALLTPRAQENAHARNGAGARVNLDAKTEHEGPQSPMSTGHLEIILKKSDLKYKLLIKP